MAVMATVSLGLTVFIISNGFELATNHDIPFAQSLAPVPLTAFASANHVKTIGVTTSGSYGTPQYLKLSSQSTKLPLVPAIRDTDGTFLSRAAGGHVLTLSNGEDGQIGNTAVYLREGWRTLPNTDELKLGANIFLDTDRDWRYMFKVSQKTAISPSSPFIVPTGSKPHLVLVLSADDGSRLDIVVGDFVNIQNIQQ
jgi:hypothetical protein